MKEIKNKDKNKDKNKGYLVEYKNIKVKSVHSAWKSALKKKA
jgi:hypothetical protein